MDLFWNYFSQHMTIKLRDIFKPIYLPKRNYAEYYEYVRKHYTFKEKFEVYTMTECKPLKDPKRLEAHIQSAIEEYFKEHKMDVGDTSVVVKLPVWVSPLIVTAAIAFVLFIKLNSTVSL